MSDDAPNAPSRLDLPQELRRCRACDHQAMRAVSSRPAGLGYEVVYRCPSCSHEVTFAPHSQLGWETTMTLIAVMLVAVFFWSLRWPSPIDLILFPGLIVMWLGFLTWRWLRVVRYPVTGMLPRPPTPENTPVTPNGSIDSRLTRRARLSFLGGLAAPIAIGLGVLGLATVIGLALHDW